MNRSLRIYLSATFVVCALVSFYFQTAVSRDEPSPTQAARFLDSLLQQEVRLNNNYASVELIGPDGNATALHPSMLGATTSLGCPLNEQRGYETDFGTFYDSEYTCLFAIQGPNDLRFHVSAYVTRGDDPTLRYRVNGYGFRLQSAERTAEMMEEIGVVSTGYPSETSFALDNQLKRLDL